ncbi:hypothetical protein [Prosthecobacter sp.]|uniref:hypothetical protein n=1 Tax=Prosthecobacter sp. TaxID=1965333 RepID=UPI00248A31AE|nr:hypothetical protein [Prosthecobacter sp.]MDI1314382.1 hypothetical protein [Prosthecobacter sp.]
MSAFRWQRKTQQLLRFPGEEAWETWIGNAGLLQRVEVPSQPTGGVTAIETLALDSAPFWSLVHDGTDDAGAAVALRWESLGIVCEGAAAPWAHWTVSTTAKRVLTATVAVTGESALADWRRQSPDHFEPSARLLPLLADAVCVWQELGRYVAAFTRGAELLHIAALTARSLNADAAFELRDLHAALQAHGFVVKIQTVQVWTVSETDFAPQLACLFADAAVIKAPRPAPVLPMQPSGMLPVAMSLIRRQKNQRQQQVMLTVAAAMICLCFFGVWWASLRWREAELHRAEAALAATQPEVDAVREAQQHWLDMEPAIEPNLYPVELFHQIVSLLPDEGIRLTEFQTDAERLIVSGEATSVNHALLFKDKLAASGPLQRYTWNFPVPRIRDEDSRAEFRAEGILNVEGVGHEAQ